VIRATQALKKAECLTIKTDPPHRRRDGSYFRARTNLYGIKFPRKPWWDRRDISDTSTRSAVEPGPSGPMAVDNLTAVEPDSGPPDEPPGVAAWVLMGITQREWTAMMLGRRS